MKKLTDNSYFAEKVKLRLDNLPDVDPLNVLDLFHGSGLIWNEIKKQTGRTINVLGIDKKPGLPGVYLWGSNIKYQIDYSIFHIIDCDAYGTSVIKNLQDILKKTKTPLIIFLTFIQVRANGFPGNLPHNLLFMLGYTKAMIKKCPRIFMIHGQEKLLNYLSAIGIKTIKIYSTPDKQKTYLCFKINGSP